MYQPLPAPIDHIVDGAWLPNPSQTPPHNLPVPNIPIGQDVQWILPPVVAGFIAGLQEFAQAGPLSTFAYNFFSQGQYRNQQFCDAVGDAVDVALLAMSRSNARSAGELNQLAFSAGYQHADTATAICTTIFPQFQQIIGDYNAWNGINAILQKWQQVRALIDQANRPPQQQYNAGYNPAGYNPGGAPVYGGGYQRRGAPGPVNPNMAFRGGNLGSGAVQQQPYGSGSGGSRTTSQQSFKPDADNRPLSDALKAKLGITDDAPQQPQQEQRQQRQPDQTYAEPVSNELADLGVVDRGGSSDVGRTIRNDRFSQFDDQVPGDTRPVPTTRGFFDDEAPEDAVDDEVDIDSITFANEAPAAAKWPELDNGRIILPVPPVGLELDQLQKWYETNAANSYKVAEFLGTPERPWDRVRLNNGLIMVPALLAAKEGIEPTRTDRRPHPHRPYDPDTQVKFYLIDGDMVGEAILEKEESMEYVNHELVSELQQAESRRLRERDNVMPDWSTVSDVVPRTVAPNAGLEGLFIKEQEEIYQGARQEDDPKENLTLRQKPHLIKEAIIGDLDVTLSRIDQYRVAAMAEGSDRDIMEAHGCAIQPFATTVSQATLEQLSEAADKSDPAKSLAAALAAYGEETKDRFYNRTNDLMTQAINNVLSGALGIHGLTITDFVMDYEDLLEEVRKEHGEGNRERLSIVSGIVASQLRILTGTAPGLTDRLVKLEGFDLEHFETNRDYFVFLQHEFSVLYINDGLSALGFKSNFSEPTQVTVSAHPALYNLVSTMDGRSADLNAGHGATLYVVSADDRILKLTQSAWDKHYYSVTVAPVSNHSVL